MAGSRKGTPNMRKTTRRGALGALAATMALTLTTLTGAVPANAASGWIATSQYGTCEYGSSTISVANNNGAAVMTMRTTGIVDGPIWCANTGGVFQAQPDRLSIRQDLWFYGVSSGGGNGTWELCNQGPRVANDYYLTNTVTTSWTAEPVHACPFFPVCFGYGDFQLRSQVWAFDPHTNLWEGGQIWSEVTSVTWTGC